MRHPQPVDSMVYPRHSGVATFMRYPHIPDARGLDVAVVGVPFDTAAGYRVGARLALDPQAERFVGNEQANAMLTRPYRKGFEVPEKV